MNKGKFIVIYGPNNLGKSTQLDLLEGLWQHMDRPYKRIKYPRYDTPTGQLINRVLRPVDGEEKLVMSDEDLQDLYAKDRRVNEPELQEWLKTMDVFGEDYKDTGRAWGLTKGVSREFLDKVNANLLDPDITILLDGERFTGGIEKGHRFEGAGQEVWETNRRIHQELAAEFGWEIVNANEGPEKVHEKIVEIIQRNWN
jgi:thymidylate kinase